MNVETFSPEEYRAKCITNDQHLKINKMLRTMKRTHQYRFANMEAGYEATEKMTDLLDRSVVVGRYDEPPKSSAMFPCAENPPRWVVGVLGSVWCDVLETDSGFIRIHFIWRGEGKGKLALDKE